MQGSSGWLFLFSLYGINDPDICKSRIYIPEMGPMNKTGNEWDRKLFCWYELWSDSLCTVCGSVDQSQSATRGIILTSQDLNGCGRAEYPFLDKLGNITAFLNLGPPAWQESSKGATVEWLLQGVIATGVGVRVFQIQFAVCLSSSPKDQHWLLTRT